MPNRALLVLLLLSSGASLAQTQYGTPAAPRSGAPAGAHGRSQAGCPWLTEGNAAHALGGHVSVTANVANTGEGSCKFSRQAGSPGSLEIFVSKASVAACPAESLKLLGVGNEAVRCKLSSSHGEAAERVSSRVRDLHFTVTLVSRPQKNSSKPPDPQDDALEQIAEQVAGNLY